MLQIPRTESFRTEAHQSAQRYGTNFGTAARALWPTKTANQLAYLTGVSKRTAEHWIYGSREPSAEAVLAVNIKMLSRD